MEFADMASDLKELTVIPTSTFSFLLKNMHFPKGNENIGQVFYEHQEHAETCKSTSRLRTFPGFLSYTPSLLSVS